MKKIILFIFIIIFINYNTEVLDANTEKLPKVSIKTVKKEFISESYIVTSRIAPFKSDTISVKSPGPIEDVYVEVGDFVKKGDVLLKIENDELEADKNNKEGELSESLARLELEEKKLERLKILMNSPSFKRAEYEDQINIVKAAEGNLIKITSQYNKAKIIYDDAILRAPYSGVISKRLVTKGNYVNTGTPVFELVNNEQFEIEANIPSDKIPLLNKKKEAEIILPDGKILKSSFRSIVPKENPNTRTVIVRFKPLFDQKNIVFLKGFGGPTLPTFENRQAPNSHKKTCPAPLNPNYFFAKLCGQKTLQNDPRGLIFEPFLPSRGAPSSISGTHFKKHRLRHDPPKNSEI